MVFRRTLATGAAVVLGLIFAQVDAGARGGGGGHGGGGHGGMASGFGQGGFGGRSPGRDFAGRHGDFDERGEHGREHEGRENRDRRSRSAESGRFDHGGGPALSGHFGNWQPGHWHVASGFGGGGRWSPGLEGVWGR